MDKLHTLTELGEWNLKIEIDYDILPDGKPSPRSGKIGTGEWQNFRVDSEADGFRLHVGKRISKVNMGDYDPMSWSDGQEFSTIDHSEGDVGCARDWGGGWWFRECYMFCGTCSRELAAKRPIGVWYDGVWEQLSRASMWIRRRR